MKPIKKLCDRKTAWKLFSQSYCTTQNESDSYLRLWKAVLIQALRDYYFVSPEVNPIELDRFFKSDTLDIICSVLSLQPQAIREHIIGDKYDK